MKKLVYYFLFCLIFYFNQAVAQTNSELLVYSAIRPSFWEIYLFENGKAKQLTHDASLNYNPTLSPNGEWLVFTSEKTGTGFLYALNLKQPNAVPKRLTSGNSFEDAAVFSPDGNTLFYVSTRDGTANIFKIPFNPDKTIEQEDAINLTENDSGNFNPAVSPDGNWLAFSSNRDAKTTLITNPQPPHNYRSTNIYIMKTDGSEVKKLTHGDNWEGSPAWSSDGKSIYFYAITKDIPQIFKIDVDGSNLKRITPAAISAVSPTVTPNNRIAFTAQYKNKFYISSVDADGKDYRVETDKKRNYWAASYDPNNAKRFVVYGQASLPKDVFLAEVPDGSYMDKPQALGPFLVNQQQVQLDDDLTLDAYAVRGYFPNYLPNTEKVVSIKEFSKVVSSNLDGSEMKQIYQAKNGYIIGLTTDGKQLATAIGMPFSTLRRFVDIWKFNLEGKHSLNLTLHSKMRNHAFPRFTPDGKHIVFRGGKEHKNIYVMDSNGKNVKQLTFDDSLDTMPAISASGDKIVFASARNGENYRIYMLTLNKDGTPNQLTKLTDGPGADVHPFFSPDDKWIVYSSERRGLKDETPLIPVFSPQPYGDIYAMRLKNKKVIAITDNKWEDSLPFWSKKHAVIPDTAKPLPGITNQEKTRA